MSREDLENLASEVFALRRRVVELEAENRELKMQRNQEAPPVPAMPQAGFAFGILDSTGPREVVVDRELAKLGTDKSCHVPLPGARMIHAVIERTARGVTIMDMGTVEGTWVNGQRITKATLASGDRIGICDAQIVIVFAAS